jgi:hypothetical protein
MDKLLVKQGNWCGLLRSVALTQSAISKRLRGPVVFDHKLFCGFTGATAQVPESCQLQQHFNN